MITNLTEAYTYPLTKCQCPKDRPLCLFCRHPEAEDCSFEKYIANSVCPQCYQPEEGEFQIHSRCAATVQNFCPMSGPGVILSFEDVCKYAIVARPLRPKMITSKSLAESLLDFFRTPFLDKLRRYPALVERIVSFVGPDLQLTALTHAVSIARRYFKSSGYTWVDVKSLKPGMTIYMAFSNFQGCDYLSHLDITPSASWTRSVTVQDQFFVCRDHFGILDICGTVDEAHRLGLSKPSAFYQTIGLRKTGVKEMRLRGFSDGVFLRALVPDNTSTGVIEWSVLSPLSLKNFFWFSKRHGMRSGINRYEYHNFSGISGISAVVQGSKTIGLFCHRLKSSIDFQSYIERFERMYSTVALTFPFFPLHPEETISAVAIRRRAEFRFPSDTPVVQVATNTGRHLTFGPQPEDESLYEYETLRIISAQNSIMGLFHFVPRGLTSALSNIGIAASGECERLHDHNISPGESLPCPSIGSSQQGWCFSKAWLEPNMSIQVCTYTEAAGLCLGLLLTYMDGRTESLGEFRFDKIISEKMKTDECVFSNQMIEEKLYVEFRSSSCYKGYSLGQSFTLPTQGKVVWWCGPHGSQMEILK